MLWSCRPNRTGANLAQGNGHTPGHEQLVDEWRLSRHGGVSGHLRRSSDRGRRWSGQHNRPPEVAGLVGIAFGRAVRIHVYVGHPKALQGQLSTRGGHPFASDLLHSRPGAEAVAGRLRLHSRSFVANSRASSGAARRGVTVSRSRFPGAFDLCPIVLEVVGEGACSVPFAGLLLVSHPFRRGLERRLLGGRRDDDAAVGV
jgi:hypothetical protein